MNREIYLWILAIVGGFFFGSVMFSEILPQALLKKDVCQEHEDHNPGAANVFASCGISMGLLCLILDMFKGFFPVYAAGRVLDTHCLLFSAVIVAPVLGHAIAPLNQFHGGKCIATSFGVTLGLLPFSHACLILAAAYILFSTAIRIGSHRLRSIGAFGVFGVVSALILLHQRQTPMALGCMLVALTAIAKHTSLFAAPCAETEKL